MSVSPAELRALLGEELHDEVVAHFAAKTDHPVDFVERQVLECLRYLYLVSAHQDELAGTFLPVEQEIDEIWHYLILQTREYREFCARLPGGFFIEHRSISYTEYAEEAPREQTAAEALRWIPLYQAAFGPYDEGALPHWTMVRFLHEQLDMPMAQIAELDMAAI
ncbi:hypothetical protein ABT337_01235 [Saccharopolyspora hirsuta]|uniref:hypothetical protein n=1 Tax=Saccharopolyspora hirsuta TaxID=1837 RepID=UPI001BA7DD06|nr:hypothetical protein [Saccharopolyspora hirsuta]